jgi:NtrC-family two-component system sensor histidine kinase KinB
VSTLFDRQTFQRQVLLGYGVAMALMVVVLGWGLVNLLRLGQASDAILRENYRSIMAAAKMRDAIQRQDSAVVFLLVNDDRHVVECISGSEQQFLLNLGKAQDNITIPEETQILSELAGTYNDYSFHFTRFLQLPRTNTEAGLVYYTENLQPQVSAIQRACDELLALNQDTMFAGSSRAHKMARRAVWSMTGVGLGAIAVAIVFSLVLSARVSRPIRELVGATERVAAGDYDVRVAQRSSNEFSDLADHFNVMVAKLRDYHDLRIGEIVAQKKKTETILQTVDDGILVVSGDRKVIAINTAAVKALGFATPFAAPAELRDVVAYDNLAKDIESIIESGVAPTAAQQEQLLTVPHGRTEKYYEYSVTPVETTSGLPGDVVVVLRDVTRLRELDRLKSEFVMTASHELRTPLTSIEMSVRLLHERAEGKLDTSDLSLFDVAEEEIVRLKHLVNELLDLTKIESGKIDMQIHTVAPNVFLQNAVEPFRLQAAQQDIELALDVPDDLPTVRADPNKITWVLTNLVGNALRYTDHGGHIAVSVERAGHWLHLCVRDDGAGIPHEKQAVIFSKFVQLDAAERGGGAGLGLAISKEIVRAHGGHIWVESEPGQGSVFTVALPL